MKGQTKMSKKEEIKSEIEIGDYKGNPTIIIHELDKDGKRKPYPFSFGTKKAKLIVKHIEDIEAFSEGN